MYTRPLPHGLPTSESLGCSRSYRSPTAAPTLDFEPPPILPLYQRLHPEPQRTPGPAPTANMTILPQTAVAPNLPNGITNPNLNLYTLSRPYKRLSIATAPPINNHPGTFFHRSPA